MTMRTLTPFAWEGAAASLLVYGHGASPATTWMEGVAAGDKLALFGPRRSLTLDLARGPIMVGDETSLAVAAAWREAGTAPAVEHVFEATAPVGLTTVATQLGLDPCVVIERRPDDRHLDDLTAAVLAAVRRHDDAPLVLTGKAQTIRTVRGVLKQAGVAPPVRVTAYWDPNRTGLD